VKLLEHAIKVVERVIEKRIREQVKIDDMQFGFRAGRGTTDAIFIVRQLQEKYREKKKNLYFAFIDLEKAFDRVPREVVSWAMRQLGVEEWLVQVVMSMYEEARTVVRTPFGDSKSFPVKVGVHQGSVLSPLLFIMVMEAITKYTREGLPWELLYADDLVLITESQEELIDRLRNWKQCLEKKGLKVNVAKTKVLISTGELIRGEQGTWPCGMCGKGVGNNSIQCTRCEKWVHGRCSGVKGRLVKQDGSFVCKRCKSRDRNQNGFSSNDQDGAMASRVMDVGSEMNVEKVEKFCYLGDTISVGGGVDQAVTARIRSGWNSFRQLASFLTAKDISLLERGKVYDACIRSCMLYGSETWALNRENEIKLERNEMKMVRWMVGTKLIERVPSKELRQRLGLEDMQSVLRKRRLRWLGHVERHEGEWIKKCTELKITGQVGSGRPKKTWKEVVEKDMREVGLRRQDAMDRVKWRSGLMSIQVTANPGSPGKTAAKRE
jgi:hypothetical protein